jgi:hypothetical protein
LSLLLLISQRWIARSIDNPVYPGGINQLLTTVE